MEKRTSPAARIAAAFALIAAVLAIVVVISAATGGGDPENRGGKGGGNVAKQQKPKQQQTKAKDYVVQSGDTLIAISRKTGVSVEEILALNPEVDPQILIAGEKLKLR